MGQPAVSAPQAVSQKTTAAAVDCPALAHGGHQPLKRHAAARDIIHLLHFCLSLVLAQLGKICISSSGWQQQLQ